MSTIHVLHVDDDPYVREYTARLLSRAGYAVHSAADGQDAADKVAANPGGYDVVVTDWEMPVLNGKEFVELLRDRAFPGRIVVFSACLNHAATAAFVGLGVNAIVQKGLAAGSLASVIHRLVG